MKITFLGAAGEVTGSQHLIETDNLRLLLDCGLFQGHRAEAYAKNAQFRCEPKHLDGVILSHAHIDHCGNLPGLYKAGFRGPIFCTPATADVASIMLQDSARIQEEDADYLRDRLAHSHDRHQQPPIDPLYTTDHAKAVIKQFETLEYGTWHHLAPDVRVRFSDAGHILGSAIVELELEDGGKNKRLVFTGDLGRRNIPLLRDPQRVLGCDVLITESTYGNRVHPPAADIQSHLATILQQAVARSGRVIIPAFSLGRTQTLVYFLNELHNAGKLPSIPVYVDSPLSREITAVYRRHVAEMDVALQRTMQHDKEPFMFPGLTYVATQSESASLNHRKGPFVVIAASGMCEAGRIRHHLRHGLGNANNTVLLIGFQAENTLGRRLQEGHTVVRIFDREVEVKARIESVNGLSAHADAEDFQWWFEQLHSDRGVGQAFIVHGEEPGRTALKQLLEPISDEPPILPQLYQSFEV